jgi:hypothetical protein
MMMYCGNLEEMHRFYIRHVTKETMGIIQMDVAMWPCDHRQGSRE